MKVEFIDENNLTVYLNKLYLKDTKFKDKVEIECYFKRLFRELKNRYNLELSGLFDIQVYINEDYGIVLSINKDDADYYDYFINQMDMRVNVLIDSKLLYRIPDIFIPTMNLENKNIYYHKNIYYLDSEICNELFEFCSIAFGDEVDEVLDNGVKICL